MKGKQHSGFHILADSVSTGIVSTGLAMIIVALASLLASSDYISGPTEHCLNLLAILLFSIPPMYAALRSKSDFSIKLSVAAGAFLLALHEVLQLVNNLSPGVLRDDILSLRPLLLGVGFCMFMMSMYLSIIRMARSQDTLDSERQRLTEEIAERKQAEDKYRELVENANSIILRMDKEGTVTFFNEFALHFFGYSREEILGHNVVGTIVPETDSAGRDLRAMILDICLHPERYAVNQNENVRRDGTKVWIAWTNKPLANASGEFVEVLCVGSDVTDRKRAEEEKVRLETQLYQAQ